MNITNNNLKVSFIFVKDHNTFCMFYKDKVQYLRKLLYFKIKLTTTILLEL